MRHSPLPVAMLVLLTLALPSAVVHPGCGPSVPTEEPTEVPSEVPTEAPTVAPDDRGFVEKVEDTNDQNGNPVVIDQALQVSNGFPYVALGKLPQTQLIPVDLAGQSPAADGNSYLERFVDSYRDTDRAIVYAIARAITRLDMLDGTTKTYAEGLPANAEIAGISGGCGDPHLFVNVPGSAATGVYRLSFTQGTFTGVRLFGTSDPGLQVAGVHALGTSVLVWHDLGGPSFDATGCGANLQPLHGGLPTSARVVDAELAPALGTNFAVANVNASYKIYTYRGGTWSAVPSFPADVVPSSVDVGGPGGTKACVAGTQAGSVAYTCSLDGGGTWSPVRTVPAQTAYTIHVGPTGDVSLGTNDGLWTCRGTTCLNQSAGARSLGIRSLLVDAGPGGGRAALAAGGTVLVGAFGNTAGVLVSRDGGKTFSSTAGLAAQQVYDLEQVPGAYLAALGTGMARSTDGGATWTVLPASSGVPAGRTVLALESIGGAVVAATFGGGFLRSTDAGLTWQPSSAGLAANVTAYSLLETSSGLYAGGANRIYRSTDGGLSWATRTSASTSTAHAVVSLAGSGSTVFAGIWDTTNNGALNGVSRTTDAGQTWTRASDGLPRVLPYGLALAGDALFAGGFAGVYRSTDSGGSWALLDRELQNMPVLSLAVLMKAADAAGGAASAAAGDELLIGTAVRSVLRRPLRPRVTRLVPIVLDVHGVPPTHFTTELSLTNRGTTDAAVTLRYTAAIGSGSGSAQEVLRAGEQLQIADVIAYLIGKGVPIPPPSPSASQAGTLLLTFDGVSGSDVIGVTARSATETAAPLPAGRAGLAYSAVDPARGTTSALFVFGLRTDETDRSNFAVFSTSDEPVSVRVTAYSGKGEGAAKVVGEISLPPYGWHQLNEVLQLGAPAFSSGWVIAERTSATGSFSAYGVINNRATGDGSYLLPVDALEHLRYVNVPVLVETGAFESELILANATAAPAELELQYRESLSPGLGAGGTVRLSLAPHEQRIIPGAIAFLRANGAAVGPRGQGGYVGSLHVVRPARAVTGIYAGARTGAPSGPTGQFGLFTGGAFAGQESRSEAYVYGLRADEDNRANVAVVHTGAAAVAAGAGSAASPITLELTAFDGAAGGVARGTPELVTLQPGQWYQSNGFLAARAVRNGWVRVRRTSGTGFFLAYGIVNDGGAPGARTGDGAYVPMETLDPTVLRAPVTAQALAALGARQAPAQRTFFEDIAYLRWLVLDRLTGSGLR